MRAKTNSEWVYAARSTDAFTPAVAVVRQSFSKAGEVPTGLRLGVDPDLAFRRIYLAAWYVGSVDFAELELRLKFLRDSTVIREDVFGYNQKSLVTFPNLRPVPFCVDVQSIDACSQNPRQVIVPPTPDPNQTGDIMVTEIELQYDLSQRVRMNAWETYENADMLQLDASARLGTISEVTSTATGRMWLGCYSCNTDF